MTFLEQAFFTVILSFIAAPGVAILSSFVWGDPMSNPSYFIKPVSGLSYYVAMIERGVGGFSADVDPDYSRRQIVDEVVNCIENGRNIVHVKFIDGNDMQDVTDEIVREALAVKAKYDRENDELDRIHERILAERDHARELRKNEVA